jgi:hypothetical protein
MMRSNGPPIMKSGPKNMPPPQPHPQSCIMASLAPMAGTCRFRAGMLSRACSSVSYGLPAAMAKP